MKILYAVAGEGRGHATRSKAVLDELKKEHEIRIISGEKGYAYLKRFFSSVGYISSPCIVYQNNKALSITTFLFNLVRFPVHLYDFFKLIKIIRSFKPNIIINDFHFPASYAALLCSIPLITIDNQHSITHLQYTVKDSWEKWKSAFIVRLFVPKAAFHIITTFFFNPLKKRYAKTAVLIPPILRKEIRSLTPRKEEYIFVYQTSTTNKQLLHDLKSLNISCRIYGFEKEQEDGNLSFRKSQKNYFSDLANAKAVIVNGSFTIITEALYLKKPLLCIPVEHQFEQILNAYFVEKLGLGLYAQHSGIAVLQKFLKNLSSYERKLEKLHFDVEKPFKIIEEEIHKLVNKQ